MSESLNKANMKAAAMVRFGKKHRWAKFLCLGGITAVYSAEYLREKLSAGAARLKEAAEAPFRPLWSRLAAFVLSGAFAFMVVPFAGVQVYAADEAPVWTSSEEDPAYEEAAETTAPEETAPERTEETKEERQWVAVTPEEIAQRVRLEGLAETNPDYRITLNIGYLKKDIATRFTSNRAQAEKVRKSFELYGIPTDDLYIFPVNVVVYNTVDGVNRVMNLKEGYSADITFPIPEYMRAHMDDLRIVRLEGDGTMVILESEVSAESNTVSFNTSRLSVFAMVTYNNSVTEENVSSGAGASASGVGADMAVNNYSLEFDRDRRNSVKRRKRRIYRIKRIVNSNDLLL